MIWHNARCAPLRRIVVVGLSLLLVGASIGRAADIEERVDALIARYHDIGRFNGSALVADGGELVLKKGYGLANVEWSVPNAPDTKFRLGSITKQFTAALIMQLVEEGLIDLGAPVTRYLPDYAERTGARVTIHQLLNHTSGIVGYTDIPGWRPGARNPLDDFSELDLLFEPGTMYSYSNSGYFLLGVILEAVTERSYEELLRERIFGPLGMNDSGYDWSEPLLARRAAGYDRQIDGSLTNTAPLDMSAPFSAGSLYSTVEDLYRWDRALHGDHVLSDESKRRMFTPGLGNHGYGWVITTTEGVLAIQHGGSINGFNALITRNPDLRRVIVLLNNTGGAPLPRMAESIASILDGTASTPPREPATARLLQTYEESGVAATLGQATEMRAGTDYNATDGQIRRLVSHLLDGGHAEDALELALGLLNDPSTSEANAELLAQAHRANGHRVEAIQSYARAIALSETPRRLLIYTDAIRELATLEPGAR